MESPLWRRFVVRTCDHLGDSCGSSWFWNNCTMWEELILKQLVKSCNPWEGLLLEKFMEDCVSWEGPQTEAEELSPWAGRSSRDNL